MPGAPSVIIQYSQEASILHSLVFIIAIVLGPSLVSPTLQRIVRPGAKVLPTRIAHSWTVAALVAAVLGIALSHLFASPIHANLFMHAVGGGITSFCLTMSVIRQAQLKLTLAQLGLVLLGVGCVLGVANEIFEYALEMLTAGRLVFSRDTHDTWRDLCANTVGMGAAFLVWLALAKPRRQG